MKNFKALILFFALCTTLKSQTAANWTVNDCSGTSHELFADLNAGKVAVIIWVMPCANCINEALAVQTEVQNALVANPGKMVFYLVDDYANTNCTTLSSWCTTNGITDPIIMSSKTVSMNPYGAAGMPKVVVIGRDQKVYYNQNAPAVNATGIKDGIAAALAAPTGIRENSIPGLSMIVSPNPANSSADLRLSLANAIEIKIEVYSEVGQLVFERSKERLSAGVYKFSFDTSSWKDGIYFVSIRENDKKTLDKIIVNH